jgi:hypothetical protein
MSDFALNAADRETLLWRKLRKHLESELADLRERNDSIKHTEQQTAVIRGRIAQIKDLLALDPQPSK